MVNLQEAPKFLDPTPMMNLSGGMSNKFFGSDGYIKTSAKNKMAYLWDEITRDQSSWKWPGALEIAKIFVEDMNPTFDTKGDAMKPGIFYGHR